MGAGCQTQSQTITLSNVPTKAVIKENKAQVIEKDGVPPQALKPAASEEANRKMNVKICDSQLEQITDFMEPWLCSAAQEEDGCQSESP